MRTEQMIVICDSKSRTGKMTIALAEALTHHKVVVQDVNHVRFSASYLLNLCDRMELHPKELMNSKSTQFISAYEALEMDERDWLHVLQNNMQLLKAPIVQFNHKVILCKSPQDLMRFQRNRYLRAI